MRKRGEGKWQRLIAAGGDVDPPADLGLQRPTDVQLWKLLERSAARGGSRYDAEIARIQLSGDAASGDILKLLTSAIAKSGITSPVHYALPDAAVAAASIQKISDKETKLSVVPEAISDLFSDQEAFENARFDLLTRLPPSPVATDGGGDGTGSAAALPFSTSVVSEALTDLHHDHNYMGARKLLELTRDGPKSREFLKAAEGEKFLEQQIGSCGLRS
ncbi:hypothetical protein PFICI_11041 [Pestalotiopsis fici W106-1]|uniref:Uncharacterized protein n=1 Tax=Pestalotiopsis fici (strain W106-1 / CGMCC3.15140) TaxID=1229662 RepID=W3WVK2_PESFW|nr:uncharacterized protein PFICI_11041 [Pestalotiopsis fici W106-1]ETS77167.1 hypothetical protein PFICI_11041 [Pestalotiopsis fici W106-1]